MRADSGRWTEVSPSRFAHEREGLEHVRDHLPDASPYHAWSNFEFVALDGSPYEVDLLVLGPAGFHLVELKAWSGKIELDRGGGEQNWLEHIPGRGHPKQRRSPLGLTRLKAQSFRSWLEAKARTSSVSVPFVHESLLLHGPGVDCRLPQHLKQRIFGREDATDNRLGRIVLDRLSMDAPRGAPVSQSQAKALVRLLSEAGLRRQVSVPKVGQWVLEPQPLDSGWGWLDNLAHHERFADEVTRVRRWFVPPGTAAGDATALARAAEREYRMLRGLDHPGLVSPTEYHEVDGAVAALVYLHDPDSQSLDSWLSAQGDSLTLDRRLEVVRRLAEVVRYAHDHGLVHRGLCPSAVLVGKDDLVRVQDWQTAGRADASTATETTHARDLIEREESGSVALYAAPEQLLAGEGGDRRAGDVFSLGALAYHVFTGAQPGSDPARVRERIVRDGGLDVSAILDAAPEALVDVVREATSPVVSDRSASVEDVMAGLDLFLEELTAPDAEPRLVIDPLDAEPGDELQGGLVVRRALGEGATSKAFLVAQPDGAEIVLKAARDDNRRGRLEDEAVSLRRLPDSPMLAHLLGGPLQVGGRTCLLVEMAGERTLASHLGRGRLTLDQLRRWGQDLIEMVALLEREGLVHRDIKPANLGVRTRASDRQPHLVLFDFSLASVPVTDLVAGTSGYRDPFLGSPGRVSYDLPAEAFSAAVTLHEMATGGLPVWGDGRTDPTLVAGEVTLHRTAFDDSVAEGLLQFFRRALARDAAGRFDNPQDMARAWETVFADAEQRDGMRSPDEDAAAASLSTPLARTGLSAKALSALEQYAATTVEELLAVPAFDLARTRGATQSTKDEITRRAQQWRRSLTSASAPTAESVDAVVRQLLPTGDSTSSERAVRLLLGQTDTSGAGPLGWPTVQDVVNEVGSSRQQVAAAWQAHLAAVTDEPVVERLRDQVVELVEALGGIATGEELATRLLDRRGSHATAAARTAQALALVRLVVEAPSSLTSEVRRAGDIVLLAAGAGLDRTSADEALDAAARLGRRAEDLCLGDALAAPATVIDALRAVVEGTPLQDLGVGRLRDLAAAAGGVAVSARGELYPRGMAAARALRLSAGALVPGSGGLHATTVQDRVRARFPQAERLPDRPRLDQLLQQAGLELTWQGDAYGAPTSLAGTASSVSSTSHGDSSDGDVAAVDSALARSVDQRGFLALAVSQRYAADALTRLRREHAPLVVDVGDWFVQELRAMAKQTGTDWQLILRMDATALSSPERADLNQVARHVASRLPDHVASLERPVLLVGAGVLAHHDCVDVLAPLASLTTPRAHAVWLLAPQPSSANSPTLDGAAVPLSSPATQWMWLPSRWAITPPAVVSA